MSIVFISLVFSTMPCAKADTTPIQFGDIHITNNMYTAAQVDQLISGGGGGGGDFTPQNPELVKTITEVTSSKRSIKDFSVYGDFSPWHGPQQLVLQYQNQNGFWSGYTFDEDFYCVSWTNGVWELRQNKSFGSPDDVVSNDFYALSIYFPQWDFQFTRTTVYDTNGEYIVTSSDAILTNIYTITTNALTRQEAEAGFTEWTVTPSDREFIFELTTGPNPQWNIYLDPDAPPAEVIAPATGYETELDFTVSGTAYTATRVRLPTMADLDGKASTNEVQLTPVYSQTPTYGDEWTFSGDVTPGVVYSVELDTDEIPGFVLAKLYADGTKKSQAVVPNQDVTSITFTDGGFDPSLTATRVRTDIIGYTLGDQTNSVLAATNGNMTATSVSNIVEDMISPIQLAKWYPDGSITNESQFTQGINYTFNDTNHTAMVKTFCQTDNPGVDDNSHLVGNVVIPPYVVTNGVRYDVVRILGGEIYDTQSNLKSVSAPITITSIGDRSFGICTSLALVSLPAATSIGLDAFNGCTSLASISLPAATRIGDYAFNGCTSLSAVSLPAATSIYGDAFYGCTSLVSVSLPAATSIGEEAFYGCTSLAACYFGGAVRASIPPLGNDAFYDVPTNCVIVVPDNNYDAWVATNGWSDLVSQGYRFLRHSEWEYARNYEIVTATNSLAKSFAPTITNTVTKAYVESLGISFGLTTNDVCNIVTNDVVVGDWNISGGAYISSGVAPDEEDHYNVPATISEISCYTNAADVPQNVSVAIYELTNDDVEDWLPVYSAILSVDSGDIGGTAGETISDLVVSSGRGEGVFSGNTVSHLRFSTGAEDMVIYVVRESRNALGLARLTDLPPLTNGLISTDTATNTFPMWDNSSKNALSVGTRIGNASQGTFVAGANNRASGTDSSSFGRNSISTNAYSITFNSTSTSYGSHGSGTANFNPINGMYGFYIGDLTLYDVITQVVTQTTPVYVPVYTNEVDEVSPQTDITKEYTPVLPDIRKSLMKWSIAASYFKWDVGTGNCCYCVLSNGTMQTETVTNINLTLPQYEDALYETIDRLNPTWFQDISQQQ